MQQLGFFIAPLPQLCRILRLLDLSVCGPVTALSSLLDAAEVIAKIISRAQHKKSCSWCTLAQPSCKVGAGHPALRSHRWPQLQGCRISFFSQQSFPFEECSVCGIQTKQGRCAVATGSTRGNHAIWKTQQGLLDSAKAEMQQQELPHSSLAFPFHQPQGSKGGEIPWQTAESLQRKYSKLQRFSSRPIPWRRTGR